MAPEKSDRDSIEAAFEAKIAKWQAALDSYRAARSADGPIGDVDVSGTLSATGPFNVSRAMDLPVGIFRDKSLKEAIPIYLQAGRRKQTNKEIAEGLKAGGFPTMSDNFESTVATALYRLKNDGVILRFPDGWDVASSYPESMRSRLEKDAKPAKKRGKAKSAAKTQKRKVEARARSKPKATKATQADARRDSKVKVIGLSDRIAAYLQTRGSEFTNDQELASQLKVDNVQVVRLTLGKMVKAEKIERDIDGRVRLMRKVA